MTIKKFKGNKTGGALLIFFAGWGMDERPFTEYLPDDRDCLICYDYRSLDFDCSLTEGYSTIQAVAWSMGVWAASVVLKDNPFPLTGCVAINGTACPVDDEKGIAARIFRGTLDGLNEQNLLKFRRRMCGSQDALERFLAKSPERTMEDLREELRCIGEMSQEMEQPSIRWDKVYIGRHDKIFLSANQQKAWEGTDVCLIDAEHYPENYWKELFRSGKITDKQHG
ncbi:MAG: DUF452 family protein [Tannerellaceae bacterium]|jgi:biotin synthesis protein BioG|nr:DUF452 family protein [Tannerellaceae bacterium]